MPDALKQLDSALNRPDGFKSGEPFDLSSPDLVETANMMPDETVTSTGWIGMNVPAPFGFLKGPDTKALTRSIKARVEANRMVGHSGRLPCSVSSLADLSIEEGPREVRIVRLEHRKA